MEPSAKSVNELPHPDPGGPPIIVVNEIPNQGVGGTPCHFDQPASPPRTRWIPGHSILVFTIPHQQPLTSRSVRQHCSWLTRITSSSNEREAASQTQFFSWLTGIPQGQHHRTTNGIPQPSFISWPTRFTTIICQPAAAFHSSFPGSPGFPAAATNYKRYPPNSFSLLPNQDSPPLATNQQERSAAVFLAIQESQQQQTTTSGIVQPSFSWPTRIPHQQQRSTAGFQESQQQQSTTSGFPQPRFSWPTRIPQQQLPTSSSALRQFSSRTRNANRSNQRQAAFPSLVFSGQPGFPTSSYQPAAAFCISFLTSQDSQQQLPTSS